MRAEAGERCYDATLPTSPASRLRVLTRRATAPFTPATTAQVGKQQRVREMLRCLSSFLLLQNAQLSEAGERGKAHA